MLVSLVILHFVNQKLTEQCLKSVKKLNPKNIKIQTVVVNNNPSENIDNLKKKFNDLIFIETKKNLGFAGGNNLGIKQGLKNEADWIFLINNDTILDKNLIVQLIKAVEKDKKIGILGPKIYFAPGYEYHRQRYQTNEQGRVFWYAGGLVDWQNVLISHRGVDEVDQRQYDQRQQTDFVSGCAMMVKKEVFRKIGFLDEKYFLYLEDVDFCRKASQAGFKLVYVPKAKLWHLNAGSSEVGGSLHDYYFSRNRMLFGMRYAPWRAKLALIKESFRLLLSGRQWQKRGIRDFYLKKFGQGSYET